MESHMTAKILKYPAFSKFKEDVGNNNQMLIAACIGIDKINGSDVGKTEPAPWNPLDWEKSVDRSRMFIIKAGLTWTIDCLDVLLKDFFSYFFKGKEKFQIDKEEKSYETVYRSIYYKYRVIEESFLDKESCISEWRKQVDYRIAKKGSVPFFPDLQLIFALLDLAIQWRNHLVHDGIDNALKQNTQRILHKYEAVLNSNTYGTLEVDRMLQRFYDTDKDKRTPSFKEVSVLIRNVIDFGFVVNAYWINCVRRGEYVSKCLSEILPSDVDEVQQYKNDKIIENKKVEYFYKIQTLTPDRMKASICMKLSNKGIVLQNTEESYISEEDKIINTYLVNLKLFNS